MYTVWILTFINENEPKIILIWLHQFMICHILDKEMKSSQKKIKFKVMKLAPVKI